MSFFVFIFHTVFLYMLSNLNSMSVIYFEGEGKLRYKSGKRAINVASGEEKCVDQRSLWD